MNARLAASAAPVCSSPHAGFGRSTCPLRPSSRFLSGCFALLFVILFFLSGRLRGSLSLCLLLSTCPAVSFAFFRTQPGQENFKVMASSLGWRSGSRVSDPAPQALLELRQLKVRGNIYTLLERARAFARRKLILKLSVLFRYGPIQDKVASDRSDPGTRVKKLHVILTLYTPSLPRQKCMRSGLGVVGHLVSVLKPLAPVRRCLAPRKAK